MTNQTNPMSKLVGKDCSYILEKLIPFYPGRGDCTICACDCNEDENRWCKAILCSPIQDCKPYKIGNSSCDVICLDYFLIQDRAVPYLYEVLGIACCLLSLYLMIHLASLYRCYQVGFQGQQHTLEYL